MRKVKTQEKLHKIHHAVAQLMERREATDISMYDVAKECGMATSTVYHHYPNIENLFHSLLDDVFTDFDALLYHCIDVEKVTHWTDINRMIETAYVDYYNNNPIARKLILGRHTFTELGHADTEHDLVLGKEVEAIYRKFFDVPQLTMPINVFAISLQVADKIYSLSYRQHGSITPELANEAIRLTESYLQLYIPHICQRSDPIAELTH
ncbi:TetR/AcrR family transcriptional regulator [Vibrio splendidus]|jgi:AcrR family transcriptional regulator|uniref:TetR/AcrR family transcriptional regulator n=1 Tax=Vibrio splendidus TaxID=29497 RepID=UPI000975C696|nr:TetR/AcrR family transcriptional regulator [Vibrio splendidus]OMO19629.1 transcriptional regulator [Vibrio splendidus]PMI70810.1 transcriptional regulator [Vibrio splendidus]PMJ93722.1 transcriptional regulator [Vibrio splendidus]PMK61114.1 transcriptional regulator [Vibrio splendidus]